jgi:hypothetical protein
VSDHEECLEMRDYLLAEVARLRAALGEHHLGYTAFDYPCEVCALTTPEESCPNCGSKGRASRLPIGIHGPEDGYSNEEEEFCADPWHTPEESP